MFKSLERLKERLHVSSPEFRRILLASVLLMVGALAYVWPNVKMVHLAYEFQVLQKERRALQNENGLLKLEKESLRSLSRIQEIGEAQLGLRFPDKSQVVTIFLK